MNRTGYIGLTAGGIVGAALVRLASAAVALPEAEVKLAEPDYPVEDDLGEARPVNRQQRRAAERAARKKEKRQ